MKISFYALTGLGKRHAGHVGMRYRNPILDYLYKTKRASVDDIAMEIGRHPSQVRSDIKPFIKSMMVEEVNM